MTTHDARDCTADLGCTMPLSALRREINASGYTLLASAISLLVVALTTRVDGACYNADPCAAIPVEAENVDYLGMINKTFGNGITAEDNAVVAILKVVGVEGLSEECRKRYVTLLGYDFVKDAQEHHFVEWYDFYFRGHKYEKRYRRFAACEVSAADIMDPHERAEADDFQAILQKLHRIYESSRERPWTRQKEPLLYRWITSSEKPLNMIVDASTKKQYFNPLVADECSATPIRGQLLIDALVIRAMLSLGEGKCDEAWRDLLACHRLIDLARKGNVAGEIMWGYLCRAKDVFRAEQVALSCRGVTLRQLNQLRDEFRHLPTEDSVVRVVDCSERYLWMNEVRKRSEFLSERGYIPSAALGTIRNDALQMVGKYVDRMIAGVKLPTYQQQAKALTDIEAELSKYAHRNDQMQQKDVLATNLLAYYCPGISTYVTMEVECSMREALVELGLALEAFRRQHGEFPTSLNGLVPQYVHALPKDLFGDGEVKYRKTASGYVLHSVGKNGLDETNLPEKEGHSPPPGNDDIVLVVTR